MLSTVSPVIVGAEAASPQPTTPVSDPTRTSTLSAWRISTPAMNTGFFIGSATAMGSIDAIFMEAPSAFGTALLEFDQRAEEVGRVNESDALARYITLRAAVAQDADSLRPQAFGGRSHVVDVK